MADDPAGCSLGPVRVCGVGVSAGSPQDTRVNRMDVEAAEPWSSSAGLSPSVSPAVWGLSAWSA